MIKLYYRVYFMGIICAVAQFAMACFCGFEKGQGNDVVASNAVFAR